MKRASQAFRVNKRLAEHSWGRLSSRLVTSLRSLTSEFGLSIGKGDIICLDANSDLPVRPSIVLGERPFSVAETSVGVVNRNHRAAPIRIKALKPREFYEPQCLRSTNSVEHDSPRGIKLLQQVKVTNVTGQYHTSVFSSRGK